MLRYLGTRHIDAVLLVQKAQASLKADALVS